MLPFRTSHIWIVSTLALLALVGLLFIQFSWLQGMFKVQEERFDAQIQVVMQAVGSEFDASYDKQTLVHNLIDDPDELGKQQLGAEVRRLLDSVLHTKDLQMEFEFGLQSCKTNQFQFFSNPLLEENILAGAQTKLGSCAVRTENGKDDHLHLYTIYPRKSSFFLKQSSGAIASALLFILVLGGAFVYTVITLLRQRKLSEMKSDFVNNLTHEFKTPIASITLAARTLKRLQEVSGSDKALNYVNLIDQEGKRLENHVDKVLQMATIDSGNFSLDRQRVNVPTLIREVLSSLRLQLERQQASVVTHFDDEASVIEADRVHLFNILYNLLDNAIKYCGQALRLELSIRQAPDHLSIEIQDNGPGIPLEIRERVFTQFYRPPSGNVHKVKGFGLGLYYVRRLVEAHGGTVSVSSQANQGSTFFLNFPRI